MRRKQLLKRVPEMFREIAAEAEHGGFDEMDQSQTELTLSPEFLNEVSTKGLIMLAELVEAASKSGITRERSLSWHQVKEVLRRRENSHE